MNETTKNVLEASRRRLQTEVDKQEVFTSERKAIADNAQKVYEQNKQKLDAMIGQLADLDHSLANEV